MAGISHTDVKIEPDVRGFSYDSFDRAAELIQSAKLLLVRSCRDPALLTPPSGGNGNISAASSSENRDHAHSSSGQLIPKSALSID